jgi:hypothetical protein
MPSATVSGQIAYLARFEGRAEHLVYPLASGRKLVRPPQEYHAMDIADCRALAAPPTVDDAGYALLEHASAVGDFYDDETVRAEYYPEVIALLKDALAAHEVVVFDHNQRSAARAARGQPGVRTPVDAAHVDYTPSSGPRRAREILDGAGKLALADRRLALINVWRPIVGPVEDVPLAVCDARGIAPDDLVETDIHHFGEEDLEHPRHSGQIYSLRHNPTHRWYYAAHMQPFEVLLLKNWDSEPGRACYTPHTGFRNPAGRCASAREYRGQDLGGDAVSRYWRPEDSRREFCFERKAE